MPPARFAGRVCKALQSICKLWMLPVCKVQGAISLTGRARLQKRRDANALEIDYVGGIGGKPMRRTRSAKRGSEWRLLKTGSNWISVNPPLRVS